MFKCQLCQASINYHYSLKDLLLPGRLTPPQLCENCQNQLEKYAGAKLCLGCGRELLGHEQLCWECQQWQQQYGWLIHNRSLYQYNNLMKEFMKQYKFMGNYALRQVFTTEFNQFIAQFDYDVLVPIPVTEHTLKTRGFNQTAALLTQPSCQALATIEKQKIPQSTKSRHDRLKTPQPFKLVKPQCLANQRVLLVDDIYTTGRTLYHAAVLCRQAHCRSVQSVTLAS